MLREHAGRREVLAGARRDLIEHPAESRANADGTQGSSGVD
jgi:hypothetical protein